MEPQTVQELELSYGARELIHKTAEFVRKHAGTDVEQRLLAREPSKFAFLQEQHPWHNEYLRALLGKAADVVTPPQADACAAKATGNGDVITTVTSDAISFEQYLPYKDFFPALRSANLVLALGGTLEEWRTRRRELLCAPTASELQVMRLVASHMALRVFCSVLPPQQHETEAPASASPIADDLRCCSDICSGEKRGLSSELQRELLSLLEKRPRLLAFLLPQHVYHPIFHRFLEASADLLHTAVNGAAFESMLGKLESFKDDEWAVFAAARQWVPRDRYAAPDSGEQLTFHERVSRAFALGAVRRPRKLGTLAISERIPELQRLSQGVPPVAARTSYPKSIPAPGKRKPNMASGPAATGQPPFKRSMVTPRTSTTSRVDARASATSVPQRPHHRAETQAISDPRAAPLRPEHPRTQQTRGWQNQSPREMQRGGSAQRRPMNPSPPFNGHHTR